MTEEKTITTNSDPHWGFITCDLRTHSDGKEYFFIWAHEEEEPPEFILKHMDEAHMRRKKAIDD